MEFTDAEFTKAIQETQQPNLVDWSLFAETKDVKIYKYLRKDSNLYEYKTIGKINASYDSLIAVFYKDFSYRKKWDSYVKDLKMINKGPSPELVHWEVAYPWPLANRDYLFYREMRKINVDGKEYCVVLARPADPNNLSPHEVVKEKSGVIRVTEFQQFLVCVDNGDGTCHISMHYFDNPKGNIPTWVINMVAKTGVPGFLKGLEDACNKYKLPQS